MRALRLMTFNVQCLPLIAGVLDGTISVPGAVVGLFPGTDSNAIDRATAVAEGLRAIPAVERPDVIALNEAFNEDARGVFLQELTPLWPHVIDIVYQGDVEEDAGLMVFSRLPFRTLPTGGDRLEHFYSVDAGDDSWASKAAVLVQVGRPAEVTTLVFTHLQASYAADDEHRDVRDAQLREILDLVGHVLGPDPTQWRDVIVAGDLNVRGDAGATNDEWFAVFDNPGDGFGAVFADSWIEQRPPGVGVDLDAGPTHRDRATQDHKRLDYIARTRRSDGEELVAHAMRVSQRTTSDHYALEALIQRVAPHCQPSTAVEVEGLTPVAGLPVAGQPLGSLAWHVPVGLPYDDGLFWVWLRRPGTYTFFAATDLAYSVFAATDLSRPLERFATLTSAEVPPSLQGALQEVGHLDPKGGTFVHREPLLVAVRSRSGNPTSGTLLVFQHLGDTPATAIGLPAHTDVEVPYPAGQPLGDNDQAWFRIKPRATLMAQLRTESLALSSRPGDAARLAIFDSALALTDEVGGAGTIAYGYDTDTDGDFFAAVTRDDDSQVGQVIRWETPVCYLRLDRGVFVHVNNESGPDWPGEDEPYLELYVDSERLLVTRWDDADTGEDWPRLTEAVRNAVVARGWTSPAVGLSQGLDIVLEDPDWPLGAAHGIPVTPINPLSAHEPPERRRVVSVTVFDTISNGTYTFACTLTRDP